MIVVRKSIQIRIVFFIQFIFINLLAHIYVYIYKLAEVPGVARGI